MQMIIIGPKSYSNHVCFFANPLSFFFFVLLCYFQEHWAFPCPESCSYSPREDRCCIAWLGEARA